jgi:plasmid maintenance system antidote protein VapI
MMQHRQVSVDDLAKLMGVGKNTICAYRSGKTTIPYKMMQTIIEILDPGQMMLANFISAVRMSVMSAWELAGKSPQTKYTSKNKPSRPVGQHG